MAAKDFYKVLGVNKNSSAEELKKAYRKLVMQYHPDRNIGDKAAEERFKEINEAYAVLGDDEKRRNYDTMGAFYQSGGAGAGARGAYGRGPFDGFSPRGDAQGQDPFQDLFGDLFNDFFQNPQRRDEPFAGRARSRKGSDLRYNLQVTLEEVATGADKTVSFIRSRDGKEETARLSIKVPAGVTAGQKLKLRGEGDSAKGGTPGDLYVIVSVQPHALFERNDSDILLELPISFVDACLGTQVEVPTLLGRTQMKIPAGTPSGQTFRLRGKGLPILNQAEHGDMLIRVMIDVPKELSAEERDALESLRKSADKGSQIQKFREKLKDLVRR